MIFFNPYFILFVLVYVGIVSFQTYRQSKAPKPIKPKEKLTDLIDQLTENSNRRTVLHQLNLLQVQETTTSLFLEMHKIKQIMDKLPLPVYLKNEAGEYLLTNEAFLNLFNFTDDIVGKKDKELFTEELMKYTVKKDIDILTNFISQKYVHTFLYNDEEKIFYVSKSIYILDNKICIIGIITDLTNCDVIDMFNKGGKLKHDCSILP
jgi:PAS domain-containing protein